MDSNEVRTFTFALIPMHLRVVFNFNVDLDMVFVFLSLLAIETANSLANYKAACDTAMYSIRTTKMTTHKATSKKANNRITLKVSLSSCSLST